jgi:hypothetical protein
MNLIRRSFPAMFAILSCVPTYAGSFDGTAPLTCGIQTVVECDRDNECYPVTLEMVNLPDFFHVDFAAEQISAAGVRRAGNTTPIERVERLGGRLLLQGGELSDENPNGGIGWSMIVDESSGRMSLSGVALEFALVANGACMLR